jgi:16S rRNA (adenine1518-N6/adenine1519-N6)-dimethyltransferase
MYKPSELQAFLKKRGLRAKKSLSQHFLIDGNIIQKMINTAAVSKGDLIIEIGPGPGALTQALLEKGACVTAIEIDALFAEELQRFQTPDHRLKVICSDILKFPLSDLLKTHPGKYKIVANLPYHVTTPILSLLLAHCHAFESLTVMVQKEFADRMTAQKRTPEYSSFTLFLQFYVHIEKSFTVSPNSFYPRPKIYSSVVHCKPYFPRPKVNSEAFFLLTRTSFGKRRKMLRSSLKDLYDIGKVEQALATLGHPTTARPEELTFNEFLALFELLTVSI